MINADDNTPIVAADAPPMAKEKTPKPVAVSSKNSDAVNEVIAELESE